MSDERLERRLKEWHARREAALYAHRHSWLDRGKGREGRPYREVDVAGDFLLIVLDDGPLPAADILALAQLHGISDRTLKRAKAALAVRSTRASGAWEWTLDATGQAPALLR